MGKNAKLKKQGKSGLMKSSIFENVTKIERDLLSSTQRIRSSKKPSRTRVRSWKDASVAPAMPCKIIKALMAVVHPTKLRQNLRCILEADESTRMQHGKFDTDIIS